MSGQRRVTRIAVGLTVTGGLLLLAGAGIWILAVVMGLGAYGAQNYDDRSAGVAFVAAKVVFVAGAVLTPLAAMAVAASWRTDDAPVGPVDGRSPDA